MPAIANNKSAFWKLRDHKKEIITALVIAALIGVGSLVWNSITTASKILAAKKGIQTTLRLFEEDINKTTFDATRYFANSVPVFFEDENQTPRQINIFWKEQFLKVFQDYHARFDFKTLKVECHDTFYSASIILYSDYFNTQNDRQFTNEKSRYDLKFDHEFRIMEVTQVVGEAVEVR